MDEFDGFDMEVRMAERDDDEENPWTDEDQAAYIAHIEDPLVYADIERREAEFLAWARTQSWAMTSEALIINRIASTVSQLSQVVGAPSRAANPAHHTQVGGSKDTESADSDSHVLAYHQHLKSLVIWTSALEIISANFTAAKSVQKYTHFLGNCHVDLADYPADFTPDYTSSSSTILLAARLHGYLGDREQLYFLLDNNVTCRTLFRKFARPLTGNVIPEVDNEEAEDQDEMIVTEHLDDWSQKDLSTRMKELDPDNVTYQCCKSNAAKFLSGWVNDQMLDDMVLAAWQDGYTDALKSYNPAAGNSFGTYANVCVRTRAQRDALKLCKDYVTGPAIDYEIQDVENKLRRPLLSPTQYVILTEKLSFLQKARGRNFLIKASDSLDTPLTADDDGSATRLDLLEHENTGGDRKIAQQKLLDNLISQLTLLAQEVVRAKYFEDLTHKEIADRMDIPLHKVSTILYAATASMASAARVAGIKAGDVL